MATTWKAHVGTVLTTALQTLFTFGGSAVTGGARLLTVTLTTVGGTVRTVSVYLIPSGQVAADQYLIYRGPTMANDTMAIPGGPFVDSAGAFVQAKQDVGTDVTARASALEETA